MTCPGADTLPRCPFATCNFVTRCFFLVLRGPRPPTPRIARPNGVGSGTPNTALLDLHNLPRVVVPAPSASRPRVLPSSAPLLSSPLLSSPLFSSYFLFLLFFSLGWGFPSEIILCYFWNFGGPCGCHFRVILGSFGPLLGSRGRRGTPGRAG